MRKSSRVTAPLFVLSAYYLLIVALFHAATWLFPGLDSFMPVGGIAELMNRGADTFDEMEIVSSTALTKATVPSLAIAVIAATALMVPISWVYFITTKDSQISRAFSQTMLILPVIVAGIANIVQHSIPLAFSLAGIVAAIRFRFTLTDPSHTLYIFAAITIGLGAGIAAIGVSTLISAGFVYATLALWRLDYGRNLKTPFFSFLTGRDHGNRDD